MQNSAPEVIAHIITYPWVSTWLAASARDRSAAGREADCICAIAAAAAHRCAPKEVDPAWIRRSPYLPTVGLIGGGPGEVTLAVRRIPVQSAGRELALLIDDIDPRRHCLGEAVAGRMDDSRWQEWQSGFRQAWDVLLKNAPERCAELTAGLASVVPLNDSEPAGTSVTFADAFGGFGSTAPREPGQFAVTLVHELQHSKLNAIMSLIQLHDHKHQVLYRVPWRLDPRPIGGVLHGVYAFAAVAQTWHALRAERRWKPHATDEFRRIKGHVTQVIDEISQGGGLTTAGLQLVSEVDRTLNTLSA